ncbi:protein LBH-like [Sphaeramia orbicularis]|uniref:protein LBH-like n=1 Tax=Sphaeramia orbicularis TaxID=375764 RepID=UPI00117E9FD7|nr:protein LBH-like [Sphaeramia orbicularis]
MSCIPESHSMTNIIGAVESPMEDKQRRGSRAYQIFPETNEDSDSYPEDFLYRRERLPSIVVDPTEVSELESGELRWPPRCCMGGEQEDEEDSSGVQTEGDGEQQEDTGMEEGSISRKSSIGPSQSQMSLSRLTPPASPTPPEAAPPCLRS